MNPPRPSFIRSKVVPRDGPIAKAARVLHLSVAEFREKLPELYGRGFPRPDATTGMFDLVAIDRWQSARHPQLFCSDGPESPGEAHKVAEERLARL
jgi:hypothetical protein